MFTQEWGQTDGQAATGEVIHMGSQKHLPSHWLILGFWTSKALKDIHRGHRPLETIWNILLDPYLWFGNFNFSLQTVILFWPYSSLRITFSWIFLGGRGEGRPCCSVTTPPLPHWRCEQLNSAQPHPIPPPAFYKICLFECREREREITQPLVYSLNGSNNKGLSQVKVQSLELL